MKDAPAPAGARCMRAARAASRGRPASRLPAGARRGGACRGGRADASSLAWGHGGLRSGGRGALSSPLRCGAGRIVRSVVAAAPAVCGAAAGRGVQYSVASGAGGRRVYRSTVDPPSGSGHWDQACGEGATTGRGCGADAVVNSAWPDAGLEVVSGADVIAALLLQRCRSEGLLVRAHSGTAAQSDECTELSEQYQPFVVVAEL